MARKALIQKQTYQIGKENWNIIYERGIKLSKGRDKSRADLEWGVTVFDSN